IQEVQGAIFAFAIEEAGAGEQGEESRHDCQVAGGGFFVSELLFVGKLGGAGVNEGCDGKRQDEPNDGPGGAEVFPKQRFHDAGGGGAGSRRAAFHSAAKSSSERPVVCRKRRGMGWTKSCHQPRASCGKGVPR